MNKLDLSEARVLTVGDIILDKYYYGKVNRISPEAPVPVVQVIKQKNTLGGAGNVVNNIAHLGATAKLFGIAGKDTDKKITEELLRKINIENELIETDNPTITKVRVIGGHQQVVRLDFENIKEVDKNIQNKIKQIISKNIDKAGAIVLSDYGKGLCTIDLCQYLIQKARSSAIPTIVDPKGWDWDKYKEATIITPNIKELGEVIGKEILNIDKEVEKYSRKIIDKYNLEYLLVTRSDKGMSLISLGEIHHIPTEAIEVYDVSGAGDTVVATIATGLASGLSMLDCVNLANKAAGIVVNKFGTAPIEFEELIHSLHTHGDSKIIPQEVLVRIIKYLYKKDHNVVFTYGGFNLLKLDDLNFLKETRNMGDKLIIGLEYPFENDTQTQDIELELIANLEFIDYVVTYNKKTLPEFLSLISDNVTIITKDK